MSLCGFKKVYYTEAAAIEAMRKANKTYGDQASGHRLYYYNCPVCEFWHLSSRLPHRWKTEP